MRVDCSAIPEPLQGPLDSEARSSEPDLPDARAGYHDDLVDEPQRRELL